MAETRISYVFLDIVGFTRQGRSVEAQEDVLKALNEIVLKVLSILEFTAEDGILLPTGDGLCIAIFPSSRFSFDVHIAVSLDILKAIAQYNASMKDPNRRFDVRIGVNENVDNVVTDINGRKNVAGPGINMAQRIMSCADAAQILVGQAVFDHLRHREPYLDKFRPYTAKVKHWTVLPVFQYIESKEGLNVAEPSCFAKPKPRLTEIQAHYVGHAIKHRSLLVSCMKKEDDFSDTAILFLYFHAKNSLEHSQTSQYETYNPSFTFDDAKTAESQIEYCEKINWRLALDYCDLVKKNVLTGCEGYFEYVDFQSFVVTKDTANKRLEAEWPDIWENFCLDAQNSSQDDVREEINELMTLSNEDNAREEDYGND